MRNGLLRSAVAACVAGAILLTPASAASPNRRRASMAARYIVSKQEKNGAFIVFSKIASTTDAILSLAAARRAPAAVARAVDFLRRKADDAVGSDDAIDAVGEKAKLVLALVATGNDPHDFGGRDFVQELKDGMDGSGKFGDLAQSETYDQALTILALRAAGAKVPDVAWSWLRNAQCLDGGWQFDEPWEPATNDIHCHDSGNPNDYTNSDTNTTALAMQALALKKSIEPAYNPWAYFRSARDPVKHGYVYDATDKCTGIDPPPDGFCYYTDANSTGLVIQAFAANSRELPNGVMKALKELQFRLCGNNAGAFAFTWGPGLEKGDPNIGATIGALPGLLQKPFPLKATDITLAVPEAPDC